MSHPPPIEISYAPAGKNRKSLLALAPLFFALFSFPLGVGFTAFFEGAIGIHTGWTEWGGFSLFAGGVTMGLAAAVASLALGAGRGKPIAIAGLVLCVAELAIALMLAHRVFHWL